MSPQLNPVELINAYRRGVFPMADARDDPELYLIDPDERGVLPLRGFHIPRRLRKTVRKAPFTVTINTAFFTCLWRPCAEASEGRETTWINAAILNAYGNLARLGYAHSVECWDGETLVGGLYGVSLGSAFFGESMFSRATDASKIALVHLVARLITGQYTLLDAQFHNPHLDQFGLMRIKRAHFKKMLTTALEKEADFYSPDVPSDGASVVQLITQIS